MSKGWKVSAEALLVLFLALSVSGAALAQVTTGAVSGVVKDDTEAVLPGVTVIVKHVDTSIARTTLTDEEGRYKVTNLALGNYEVQAELAGFQTEVRSGIRLTVGREAIVDFRLKVGEITERIVVTGEAPLVQQTSSSLSSLVEQKTITDLPLSGRNYMQLAVLQAATHQVRTGGTSAVRTQSPTTGMGLRFSTGGARDKANLYLFDGTQQTDVTGSTPASVAGASYGVDTIREFQVLSSAYSAEYGGRSGGVINVVSRSGTNELHGSVFYFHRNDNLDARNFFDPGTNPPEFKRNQFGFTVEGPVLKNKTFFIGSYEGFRQRLGRTLLGRVPTLSARQGVLPDRRVTVDPLISRYLRFYPLPNGRDFGDGTAELIGAASIPTDEDFVTAKLDHHWTDRHTLSGRYSITDGQTETPSPLGERKDTIPIRNQHLNLELVSILSPNLLNAARFGFNRSYVGEFPVQLFDIEPDLLLVPESGQFGALLPTGMDELRGKGGGLNRVFIINLFHATEQLGYNRGRHSTKFGFDFRRTQFNYFSDTRPGGRAHFPSLTDFLTGRPNRGDGMLTGSDTIRGVRQSLFGFYVQDDFRWSASLTLNLGLRYEFITIPTEVNEKSAALRNILTDTEVTIGPFLGRNPSLGNVAPRLGLAWDPTGSGKTSLRAGFGIFHDEITTNYYTLEFNGVPLTPHGLGRVDVSRVNPPFPRIFEGFTIRNVPTTLRRFTVIDYLPKQPVRFHYQMELQRQLSKDLVVEAGYTGSRSNHLARRYESANQAVPSRLADGRLFYAAGLPRRNPALGPIQYKSFDSQAFYNSLHVGIRKRFSEGMGFQANYTWSKSVDDSSATFDNNEMQQTADIPYPDDRKSDRGLSDFHVGHHFAANFIYELPFGRGKRFLGAATGIQNALLGGWQVNGLVTAGSGFPFHPLLGFDRARAIATEAAEVQRPDLVPGRSNNPVLGGPDRYFDPTAFSLPGAGFLGNLGRNTILGPGLAVFDLALFKNIAVGEGRRVQFRAEFFNLLNRANFGLPSQRIFSSTGLIGSVGRIVGTATTSRQVQFGLKFLF